MKLKVLKLIYKGRELYNIYPYWEFMDHSAFIWYYLSNRVKKLKIEMSQPFQEIIVDAGNEFETYIYDKRLLIPASFDLEKFEAAEKAGSIDYYLELFEEGLEKVKEGWGVPYVEIKKLIEEGRETGFLNRRVYKRLRLPDYDLKAEFIQYFNRNEIAIDVIFSKISTKNVLCKGHLFRSLPEIRFINICKKIWADIDRMIIEVTAASYNIGYFDISEILQGKFEFHYTNPDDLGNLRIHKSDPYWFGWYKYNLNYIGDNLYWHYPIERPKYVAGLISGRGWDDPIYKEIPKKIQTVARPL